MTVKKEQNGTQLALAAEGRIDTTTAPQLQEEVNASIDGITELVFDFADVQYISSAGLRVLLSAQKVMNKQGTMKLCHVSDDLKEIFEVTGFDEILTIE